MKYYRRGSRGPPTVLKSLKQKGGEETMLKPNFNSVVSTTIPIQRSFANNVLARTALKNGDVRTPSMNEIVRKQTQTRKFADFVSELEDSKVSVVSNPTRFMNNINLLMNLVH